MREYRGFEEVARKHRESVIDTILPTRGTKSSAGYDFRVKESFDISPGETVITMSDVKAFMLNDEVLQIHIRSSIANKRSLRLTNSTSIIDSDYYENNKNDGNIGICLHNFGDKTVTINSGERICQGIFVKYLTSKGDESLEDRSGGFGSTGTN